MAFRLPDRCTSIRAVPAVASTEMVDVWNCTLTGIAETALENSEVSPVEVLVAVAVTQVFAGRLLDGVNEMAAFPWPVGEELDRKSTRLNSSHVRISYA